MRVTLFCLFGGLASIAGAQEAPSSLPSTQPASQPSDLPFDEAANALSIGVEPISQPLSNFPYVEPNLTPPLTIPPLSNPGTAAALAIIPGVGHYYLGNFKAGNGYLGGVLTIGITAGIAGVQSVNCPDNPTAFCESGASDLVTLVAGAAAQNLWFYNIFDAYRDARVKRHDIGYQYPITREPLTKLMSAPFRSEVLQNPWVWAGVPAALVGGFGVSVIAEQVFPSAKFTPGLLRPTPLLTQKLTAAINGQDIATIVGGSVVFASVFVPVGVGEEALFRGCFQSGFTQQFGPVPGWIMASLLFGSVHIGNFVERDPLTGVRTGFNEAGYFAVPYITLVGAGLGYMYMNEGYKLEAGVAAHFWYDLLLSVGSLFALANEEPAMLQFSFPL